VIDFYPKDIKEIAAGGGSWGALLLRKKSLKKMKNLWAEPRNKRALQAHCPQDSSPTFGSRLDSELKTTLHHEPFTIHHQIGPCPMQLVVPSAVRKAVSAATATFTTSSIIRFFFIIIDS